MNPTISRPQLQSIHAPNFARVPAPSASKASAAYGYSENILVNNSARNNDIPPGFAGYERFGQQYQKTNDHLYQHQASSTPSFQSQVRLFQDNKNTQWPTETYQHSHNISRPGTGNTQSSRSTSISNLHHSAESRHGSISGDSGNRELLKREEEIAHLKYQIKELTSRVHDMQTFNKQSIDPVIKAKFEEKSEAINERNDKVKALEDQLEQITLAVTAATKKGGTPDINIPGIDPEACARRILTRILTLRQENQTLAVSLLPNAAPHALETNILGTFVYRHHFSKEG